MLVKIYKENPNPTEIYKIANDLRRGAVIIIPTDGVYAFACDLMNYNAVERIVSLKKKNSKKSNLSFICNSMSQVSEYAKIDDLSFALMKKNLPGPFTFILNGSSKLPKIFKDKKTVGIRMPDNQIVLDLVSALGNPMMTSSIFIDEETTEYVTDPELIEERYGDQVVLVIDGGMGSLVHSTIVDCTQDEPLVVREGGGILM